MGLQLFIHPRRPLFFVFALIVLLLNRNLARG